MRITKNLLSKQLAKCCKKICEYSITLKRINDIVCEKQNVILWNKITKISSSI